MLLAVSALLAGACSSGPTYANVPQSNAASLKGPVVPTQGSEDGNCTVVVVQVDGLNCDFTASHEGQNWHAFGNAKPLFVAPKRQKLVLNISYEEAAGSESLGPSPQGQDNTGTFGDVGEYKAGSVAEVFATFEAGHIYRITADYKADRIDVILWDETRGPNRRSDVADWSFDCTPAHAGGSASHGHVM
jgi:hypothetical protein